MVLNFIPTDYYIVDVSSGKFLAVGDPQLDDVQRLRGFGSLSPTWAGFTKPVDNCGRGGRKDLRVTGVG